MNFESYICRVNRALAADGAAEMTDDEKGQAKIAHSYGTSPLCCASGIMDDRHTAESNLDDDPAVTALRSKLIAARVASIDAESAVPRNEGTGRVGAILEALAKDDDPLELLREAVELMPLGTAKRADWMNRASVVLGKVRS